MDIYTFEDYVQKPYKFVPKKKKEVVLGMSDSFCCLMYIYLNCWNTQLLANKIAITGVWRGFVALTFVTYFFSLPTMIMCLYLGKFLRRGVISLHKCCPLLFGASIFALLLMFPLSSLMVYYPMAGNLFMNWIWYGGYFPPCKEFKSTFAILEGYSCIEEKISNDCCTNDEHDNPDCRRLMYPFLMVYKYINSNCYSSAYFSQIECDFWLLTFIICVILTYMDIKSFHRIMIAVEKLYITVIYIINVWCLMHFEVVLAGLWFYYMSYEVTESLTSTLFEIIALEVDNVACCVPFFLLMGNLIDERVSVEELVIKVTFQKIKRLFHLVNLYILAISIVATHYQVSYICLHDEIEATTIALGVIPQLIQNAQVRVCRIPIMIMYFCSIILKKHVSLILYGNLLACHFWLPRSENLEEHKSMSKMIYVKLAVFILLILCYRDFNTYTVSALESDDIMLLFKFMSYLINGLNPIIFSVIILYVYSVQRFKTDVEGLVSRKLSKEILTYLTYQPIFIAVFTAVRLYQYFSRNQTVRDASTRQSFLANFPYYMYVPLMYLILVIIITASGIVILTAIEKDARALSVSRSWGPVDKNKWRKITPYHPGRKLTFYNHFLICGHVCFINSHPIKKESEKTINEVELFSQNWPCIFETKRYKVFKSEVEDLIKQAYTWGILSKFDDIDEEQ